MKNKSGKTGKRTALFIVLVLIGIYLYHFPVQRIKAIAAVDRYLQLQAVDHSRIESREISKDYKQNGHYIKIRFKTDPEYLYSYHYKKNGDVHLIIYNSMNASVDGWYTETPPVYPPLSENPLKNR